MLVWHFGMDSQRYISAKAGKNEYVNYMLRLGCRYLEIDTEAPIETGKSFAYGNLLEESKKRTNEAFFNEDKGVYSIECTGVTSTLSTDTGLSRSATEFYNELIAGGMIRPSEQSTFDTEEKLSIGWIQKFYRNNGVTVFRNANCVCEISVSPFVNWGVF